MKNFKKLAVALFIFSLCSVGNNAYADIIVGSGNWQSWTLSDLNNDGTPYWDHSSWDVTPVGGNNNNIGYCLTSDNCGTYSPHPGTIQYWGMGDGTADPSFYFRGSAGSNDIYSLVFELAGYSPENIFGWYQTDSAGNRTDAINHTIFLGGNTAGDSQTIPVSEYYGFFFTSGTGKTYYTQSGNNSDQSQEQHFSIFQNGNTFWLGMEDLSFCHTDKDYNDMILYVTIPQDTTGTSSVPEPSSLSLIVAGILGLGILRRFKI